MPPKGVAPVQGPWTAEAEEAAFDSLLAQFGGSNTQAAVEPGTAPKSVTAQSTRSQPSAREQKPGAGPNRYHQREAAGKRRR